MRWFIEVSSVEGGESDAEYCVDAKQWQSALQQARKLRGDAGPLSTFSIELLDNGYRAVDRKQKLRYIVKKAPNDAPLNDGKNGAANPTAEAQAAAPAPSEAPMAPAGPSKTGPPPRPRLESGRPSRPSMSKPAPAKSSPPKESVAPTALSASVTSGASAATAPAPSSPGLAAGAVAAVTPARSAPPAAGELEPVATGGANLVPSAAADDAKAARVQAIMGQSTAPRPTGVRSDAPAPSVAVEVVPSSQAAAVAEEARRAEQGADARADSGEAEDPVPLMKTRQHDATPPPADPSAAPVQLKAVVTPDAEVIRARGEEPTKETPITYRELALAVRPGTSREGVQALLWERYRALAKEIEARPRGKFVQLAVFDHVFSKKPLRPPLALFLWKDWRGDPVLSFPGFKSDGQKADSPSDLKEKIGSLRPTSVIPIGPSTSPAPSSDGQQNQPVSGSSVAPSAAPQASPDPPGASTAPAASVEAVGAPGPAGAGVVAVEAASAPAEAAPQTAAEVAAPPIEARAPEIAKPEPAPPADANEQKVQSGPKRRAGEDLIGDLFESMHELHFMADVVSGAEFVLSVLQGSLPSQLSLIQVFDINTGQFVVVRQAGGNDGVLMHQTPDSDSFVHQVMKAPRATSLSPDEGDEYFKKGRWQVSGVVVKHALSGPVRQGGRYLGLIELANPVGSDPYHESEANALDYICEQFAEFLANRPIVLDADVILRKT